MKLPGVMLAAASQCIALLSAALCLGGGAMAQNQPAPAASANLVMNGCRFVNSPSNYQDLFMQGRCLGVVSVLVDFSPGVCLPPGAITINKLFELSSRTSMPALPAYMKTLTSSFWKHSEKLGRLEEIDDQILR